MTFAFAALSFSVGIAIRRFWSRADNFAYWLNEFVIWIAMPAMILRSIPGISFGGEALLPIVVAWLSFALAVLAVSLFARWFKWDASERLALSILVGLGNTAFLGIPYVQALLGDSALATAILYDQLGSFLVLSICAVTLIAVHTQKAGVASSDVAVGTKSASAVLGILKRIFGFPPFASLLVSLFLPIQPLVAVVSPVLDILSLSILPIALLVVGLHFRFAVDVRDLRAMLWIGAMKLAVFPALLLLVVGMFGLAGTAFAPVLLQNAMPPMITPALLLIAAGIAPRLVATSLGYLTVVGCGTVYLWHLLI